MVTSRTGIRKAAGEMLLVEITARFFEGVAGTMREIDRASATMRDLNSYTATEPEWTRRRLAPEKGDNMANPLRKFAEFNRELDRGLAVMRGEEQGVQRSPAPFRRLADRISEANRAREQWMTGSGTARESRQRAYAAHSRER